MDFGLLVTFRLGQERAIPLIESVEAISVVSLGMLGSSLCIRLLLRGDTSLARVAILLHPRQTTTVNHQAIYF